MSSNSDSSNGSDKCNSESDGGTKRVSKPKHTGNKSEKISETYEIKESLEDKITEAIKNVSVDKRENLTIKVVPLNVKLLKDNVSYCKITTQVVENSILKTVVTPIWNIYAQQENEETRTSLNKSFIKCSKHLRLLLGAISPVYRPQLIAAKHSQPVLRKISSQKELKQTAENLKNTDSVVNLPQSVSKSPFTKLIFGTVTPSHATKQLQIPLSIKQNEQQEKKIAPEPALHKLPEIKMAPQDNNASTHSLSPCRQKLLKKQYKHIRAMKPRNEKELKMKGRLLKLLFHLKQTAEETENIIKAIYHHNDIEHLQEYFNTQLNKTTSSNEFQSAHRKYLDSLQTKILREAKEYQQKLDINKEKQKDVSILSSHNDRKYRGAPEDILRQTSIRSTKELDEHSKPVDNTSTESKRNVLNATRQILPSKEQKPIKVILQKVENRKRTMKLWNDNDYILDKLSHRNNGPPIPIKEKQKEIKEHKTADIAENTCALNETKSSSSSKMLKEKAEYPSLGRAEYANKKPDSEACKINPIEQVCIIKKSSSKNCNQSTNTPQQFSPLPKASLGKVHAIGRQNIKFMENKDQNDKEKTENATALKSQKERKVKSKLTSQKLPAVKRERLRLSKAIRQKGRVCTYCKPRAISQKLPLIPTVNKANLTKSIRSTERTEGRLNETKATGSVSNNSADKTKHKEAETQLKGRSLSQKNEKPFSSNESNIDLSESEKQNTELLKSKSTAVTETSTKPQSSKGSSCSSSSSKNEDLNLKQEERNALKSKADITNKKIVLDRAAAKAELKEIELQRKQELQALKEKLTRPKTAFSKSDAYYEYLMRKLPPKRQQTMKTKTVSNKKCKTSAVNKKAESLSVVSKHGTERQKLNKHKSKVLSQKEIDQYFKCSSSTNKSCSGSDLIPMPKYGCQHSHLIYEDLKSIIKMKTDGNSCKKLPQKTKVLEAIPLKKSQDSKPIPKEDKFTTVLKAKKNAENDNQNLNKKSSSRENKMPEVLSADKKINSDSVRKSKATALKKSHDSKSTPKEDKCTPIVEALAEKDAENGNQVNTESERKCKVTPLKKSHNSKSTPKEDKFTPILEALAEKDAKNDNQNLNKKSYREVKMPEVQCADEKINTESEKKNKAQSNTKTMDTCKSIQPGHKLLEPCMLHCIPQKKSSDACEKQYTHTSRSDLKHTVERVKELYLFTAPDTGKQPLKNEQHCNPKKSVKEMTKLKDSFSAGMKHMQEFQKSLQNKLKSMGRAVEKNKAEELKAKQAIKKALLTNIHEAVKVKDLKDGFRNNFHWHILKAGIQNSIHGRQLLSAVKQSLKSLCVGFKGSVNSKELQSAFREGIKPRELLYVVRQSVNLPLLFKGLTSATKEYAKLKYNTFKKIQEKSSKKDGGDNNGSGSGPKQSSAENCNKQRRDAKREARTKNKSQMLYRLNNTSYEQTAAQPLLTKDIRKLMTEILKAFPTLPLKTAECLQFPHVHKYISKHFTGLNTSVSYIESRPMHKSVFTTKELAFVLKSSGFVADKAEQKSACLNQKRTNVPSAASKEVKFFQGFWRNYGPRIAVKGQTNNDMYSKQSTLQQLNAVTKAIYEADRNAFTAGLNRRLSLNQLLRDFFSVNEHSPTARKTELNKEVSEKSPEEALHKLIHDNMHTVNKRCISENSVHNANKTLKEKILLFFLKHDMIYVTEDMPKHLIPSISKNISNTQNHISASIQEIHSSSHKYSDSKSPRETAENMHSSVDKESAKANVTETQEKSTGELGKPQAKPEHVTATKPEKLSVQHCNNETNLTGLSKYFNSETITGRANVAKATLACLALGYLYYHARKRSGTNGDTKLSK